MDCERIREFSPPGGPADWALSERSIAGFADTLEHRGATGTFFIVPETAEQHASLFRSLRNRGFELGLHYHPQAFLDGRYGRYLGEYTRSEQKEQLAAAKNRWEDHLGLPCASFRSGNFSASDDTFPVLAEMGFRQTSSSLPGRHAPQIAADWVGAQMHPHRTDAVNRLASGQLSLFEVPVTADPTGERPGGGVDPLHLRLESIARAPYRQDNTVLGPERASTQTRPEDFFALAERMVRDQVDKQIPVKTIVAGTHNMFEFGHPDDIVSSYLIALIDQLKQIAVRNGLTVIPATIEDIRKGMDES